MNNERMAQFIVELRKSKKMTQKELAEKLNVTDKAVSKWERGLCYPDISLISPMAEIFGVSTTELLNGERSSTCSTPNPIVETALQYAQAATQSKLKHSRTVSKSILTGACLIAIIVCTICDIALSGTLTWSLYPIYSIVFAWLILFPLLQLKQNSIRFSLVSLSIFIIPFLFALNTLADSDGLLIPMGVRISIVSIGFLWVAYILFVIMRTNRWNAATISTLLAIPVCFVINLLVSHYISEPMIDIWDMLNCGILAMIAITFFTIGQFAQRKNASING